MGILDDIVLRRRERLAAAMRELPLREVRARARDAEAPRDFRAAVTRPREDGLPRGGIRLIAEVKRASPSRGVIRRDFDPRSIARAYDSRADAISVLTEEDFFQGDLAYIAQVKRASGLPVLRKDFIIEEYQLHESRAREADAVLLIADILEGSQGKDFVQMAREMGLAVLFEAHDLRGLDRVLRSGADIVGINNRNLSTLSVDLGSTFALMKDIPREKTVVSESGIGARRDVERLEEAGVDAILVGTAFMESPDIQARMNELLGPPEETPPARH
jgi:indole-3-glycerol phosphate synthase